MNKKKKKNTFEDLYDVVKILRKKCPWDKSQTLNSIKKEILEEVYEVHDALEKRNYNRVKEEMGDVLLSLFLMIRIAEEQRYFTKKRLIDDLVQKIIKKHPHVFKGQKFKDKKEFLKYWESEKKEKEVNIAMPSLLLCEKILKKMKRLGREVKKNELESKILKVISKNRLGKKELSSLLFLSSLLLISKGYSPEEIVKKKCRELKA